MANKKQKTRGNWQKLHKNANKIEFFSVSEWRWKKYLHRYNANKKHIEVNTLRDILKWCWFHNSTKMFDINFYSIGFSKILKLCEVRNILSVEDFLKKKLSAIPFLFCALSANTIWISAKKKHEWNGWKRLKRMLSIIENNIKNEL